MARRTLEEQKEAVVRVLTRLDGAVPLDAIAASLPFELPRRTRWVSRIDSDCAIAT